MGTAPPAQCLGQAPLQHLAAVQGAMRRDAEDHSTHTAERERPITWHALQAVSSTGPHRIRSSLAVAFASFAVPQLQSLILKGKLKIKKINLVIDDSDTKLNASPEA